MYTVPSPDGLSFSFFILCCVFSEIASSPLKVTSISKHKQIQASLPERRALCIPPGPMEDDSWLPLFLPALIPTQAFVTAPQRQMQPCLGLHKAHNHGLDAFPAKAVLSPNLVPTHIPEEVASSVVAGLSLVS